MTVRPDGAVIWITGLPASGKSTLAKRVVHGLAARGEVTMWLDSDDLREVITPNPTYSERERDLFYRALGHIATLSAQGGATAVVSATAPRQTHRDAVRAQVPRFIEVYIECDEDHRRARDFKGLYAMQDAGEISSLPGIGSTYEVPRQPELKLDSVHHNSEQLGDMVFRWLDGPGHFADR